MRPAVVPCAMADEESGSSLKLGSCVEQPLVLLGTRKLVLDDAFLSNESLLKILLSAKQTLVLSLIYPMHYILFIPPPWVWLDEASPHKRRLKCDTKHQSQEADATFITSDGSKPYKPRRTLDTDDDNN